MTPGLPVNRAPGLGDSEQIDPIDPCGLAERGNDNLESAAFGGLVESKNFHQAGRTSERCSGWWVSESRPLIGSTPSDSGPAIY